jgi:hypothetical protein
MGVWTVYGQRLLNLRDVLARELSEKFILIDVGFLELL